MHILVINDDGPPSNQSSPYIHPFIHRLQSAGHLVSVVLPHQQRSWISKAHFVGQLTKPTYFHPGPLPNEEGTTHNKPSSNAAQEEWILVDGTPATCAQLGLFHFFQDRPPIDLVVSGPNYGRNSTSLFILSSGTIGGAMEAAVCQKRAIALSFAFWSRENQPDVVAAACEHSIKLIEHLAANWGRDVDLYSINVPLVKDVGSSKVMYTNALQNHWTGGSSFQEVEAEDEADPEAQERAIRSHEGDEPMTEPADAPEATNLKPSKHKWFKWAPRFSEVQKTVSASAPGNDGWAVHQGYTSITPFKANYMHAADVPLGELKLESASAHGLTTLPSTAVDVFAAISADTYTAPLITKALDVVASRLNIKDITGEPIRTSNPDHPLLHILPYEAIDFEHHLSHPSSSLANSYIIRKALIRKHHLWHTASSWWSKHPGDTALKNHIPLTVTFELDFAEFLDDALVECFELHDSFAKDEREWWVLKPAMSDQGQGVRLFSSFVELQAVFEEWERTSDNEGEEDDLYGTPGTTDGEDHTGAGTMTSQLRHFVAQRYIDPPLLFLEHGNRKFHLRTYVLAVGALQVYVYREMLALFAPEPYRSPASHDEAHELDSRVHLTNTCLHAEDSSNNANDNNNPETANVARFWDLPSHSTSLDPTCPPNTTTSWKTAAFNQICAATGTLYEAAAREQMIHFQTLPNSFEVFGVDWMVDARGNVWLLEVNAFPDFKQSGDQFRGLVQGLWEGVARVAVVPFFCKQSEEEEEEREDEGEEEGEKVGRGGGTMTKVLDIDLGRR